MARFQDVVPLVLSVAIGRVEGHWDEEVDVLGEPLNEVEVALIRPAKRDYSWRISTISRCVPIGVRQCSRRPACREERDD